MTNRFDEYKFFASSTQHLAERRQATTQTYLSLNTANLAVLALLGKVGVQGWWLVGTSLPLIIVGSLACCNWERTIGAYKRLIAWRYDQLMAMEETIPDSYRMYTREWEEMFRPRPNEHRFGFSRLEVWFPRLFLVLYWVYGLTLIAAAAVGVWQASLAA